MAIERAIYASLPLGIEKNESGFQYYSYTPGFKALLEVDTSGVLLGLATAGYKEPDAGEWLLDLPEEDIRTLNSADYRPSIPSTIAECNLAELKAKRFHPYSFSYRQVKTADGSMPVFAFGKDMGFDWTGRRPGNSYNYVLTCDNSDIKRSPVRYCSSPAVCCNIPRSEFFPETGSISQPSLLSRIGSLDTVDDLAPLKYTAAFDDISSDDIVSFLSEEERMEIFLSMITALMEYKGGNHRRRLIIADTRENTMLWIAAISYIFPLENILDLSFSSYTYYPSDYDINGVFDPLLNGCFSDSRSGYSFDIARNAYAVYDFRQCSYAPEVSVADNIFNDAVNNAFAMNLRIIDTYKDYIVNNTSYRGLDLDYADGYDLFAYVTGKKIKYNLGKAISFAKKYISVDEKKKLLNKMMNECADITKSDENKTTFCDYIDYCCNNGIEKLDTIKLFFIYDVSLAVFDTSVDSAKFLQKKNICLTLGNITDKQLAVIIVTKNDKRKFLDLVSTTSDGWRISYIVSALCCTAETGKCSIQCHTDESKLIVLAFMKLFEADTINDTINLKKFIDHNFNILSSTINKIFFADAAYIALEEKNYPNCMEVISEIVAKMYINGSAADKKDICAAIARDDTALFYVDKIISYIGMEQDNYKLISNYQELVDNSGSIIKDYIDSITDIVIKSQNNVESASAEKRMNISFATYSFLRSCAEKSILTLKTDDIQKIYNDYLKALTESAPNYIIGIKSKNELLELNKMLASLNGKINKQLTKIFVSLSVMSANVENTGADSCFQNCINYNPVDVASLSPDMLSKYIKSTGKLCGEYWVKNNSFPMFEQMIYVGADNKHAYYEMLYEEMIVYVLKNTVHGTSRRAADIIEIAIIKDYKKVLDDITKILLECNVKKNVVDQLEKDIKLKTEPRKKGDKEGILSIVDIKMLQKCTENIRGFYSQNSNGMLNSIFGLFGKKK